MGSFCCPSTREDYEEIEELLRVNNLSIRVLSWNVAAHQPDEQSVKNLLNQKGQREDILVIGLQEIIDINNAKNMLIDDDTPSKWEEIILKELNASKQNEKSKAEYNNSKYTKLSSVRMMGVLLEIYVKNTFEEHIHSVWRNKVGAGLFNIAPNKGGVGIRFNIFNTSICFVCAHLAAHQENTQYRNDNYHKIMNELTFYDDEQMEYIDIDSHDLVFFFGDLNYRLNFEEDELESVYSLIDQQKWDPLLVNDQLLLSMEQKKAFDGFSENEIKFAPTYKYEIGSSEFEKTKKRIPSYCDRILWKLNSQTKHTLDCLRYDSIHSECMSDHKPVVGVFNVKFESY